MRSRSEGRAKSARKPNDTARARLRVSVVAGGVAQWRTTRLASHMSSYRGDEGTEILAALTTAASHGCEENSFSPSKSSYPPQREAR